MAAESNYGFIIRHLRTQADLSVRMLAQKTGRSIGWISEIENSTGTARLTEAEFNRIVEILDGSKHREMFRTWVATHKRSDAVDRTFDGAVLKYIRIKKELRLHDAAKISGISASRLSKVEGGVLAVTPELRNTIMLAYGYSPSSFKNLSTDPVRSKAVPAQYKLEILLKKLSHTQIAKLYAFAQTITNTTEMSEKESPHV